MDLTEAFAPSQAGAGAGSGVDEKPPDYFDFAISPGAHGLGSDGGMDEDSFLGRVRLGSFLGSDSHLHHDGFVKETNNNTLTALPPVSTITGSLGHLASHQQQQQQAAAVAAALEQSASDCDYWVTTDDSKEQTCSILLEDLNKYCWSPETGLIVQRARDDVTLSSQPSQQQAQPQPQQQQTECVSTTNEHRQQRHEQQRRQQQHRQRQQNTDGAIYTLTVLNSEASSMDGLECCKSPGGAGEDQVTSAGGGDAWSLRPVAGHLDLDAILGMESGHEPGFVTFGLTIKAEPDVGPATSSSGGDLNGQGGDNNNDWKLSDRNQQGDEATGSDATTAESLLRSALQGKLYSVPTTTRNILAVAADSAGLGSQLVGDCDEPMQQGCTTDELLLSQLEVDPTTYRAELKGLAGEVVESYCNLEPVCNVQATTVMYTLDPASGSLGTITLPAELAQVGTVTVVTTTAAPSGQQEVIIQGKAFLASAFHALSEHQSHRHRENRVIIFFRAICLSA
ncbi:hypothetical protein QAD02_022060 [Eretmocerus hayati]|uniref:Uncharacterized protein n=1 Tax=Eretmocerus hayati TaxID=131215 RepID=A0ACC2PTJ9_9HYME|nr:hypothetical protein QAD02_022060 [Eretmocerus hayati]